MGVGFSDGAPPFFLYSLSILVNFHSLYTTVNFHSIYTLVNFYSLYTLLNFYFSLYSFFLKLSSI